MRPEDERVRRAHRHPPAAPWPWRRTRGRQRRQHRHRDRGGLAKLLGLHAEIGEHRETPWSRPTARPAVSSQTFSNELAVQIDDSSTVTMTTVADRTGTSRRGTAARHSRHPRARPRRVRSGSVCSAARMQMNQKGKPRQTVAAMTAGIAVERWPSQSIMAGNSPVALSSRLMPPPIGWYSTRQARNATKAGIAQGSMRIGAEQSRARGKLPVHQQREPKPDAELADIADHDQHDRVPHAPESPATCSKETEIRRARPNGRDCRPTRFVNEIADRVQERIADQSEHQQQRQARPARTRTARGRARRSASAASCARRPHAEPRRTPRRRTCRRSPGSAPAPRPSRGRSPS